MSRILAATLAILLALSPAVTFGATAHKPRVARWHGYGFLPGYHQPPDNSRPVFGRRGAFTGEADYTPQYIGYDGELHYFGRPGFVRGRYNGGSFGPCWSWTPIGPAWQCGPR